ncbi:MAG: LytTr DNA-binding protein [Lachnospiraceae bacterium]|jgi:DNA-binding LytR/AlgR family response regulator|nr:LytTr DNA-binding protein [Lachnospiraceae bacterium]
MFRVGICDDEQTICTQIENIILNYNNETSMRIDLEVFYTGEGLCEFIENEHTFDLIFLDIELKTTDGIEIGRKIRKEQNDDVTQIIYISAKQGYAMDLFENRPLNFLLKPLREEKIIKYLNEAMLLYKKYNLFFEFSIGKEFYKVPFKDIIYFVSHNKKINIITINRTYESYMKLDDIKRMLQDKDFLSIHKSYLVNYMYISESQHDNIKLTNGDNLPISQTYRKEVRDTLMNRRKGRK